jgi:pimeloyl-ACP methyl ester carboxylesterase
MRTWAKRIALALAALLVAAAGTLVVIYGPALAFLMDIAGYRGAVRALLPDRPVAFTTRDRQVPTRDGPLLARIYTPARSPSHTVVVFPGVHGGGVDEPRLATFCGRLASTGLEVVCAPLPELRHFLITHHSTDAIEDVTLDVANDPSLTPRGRVGLVGVSFSGGLALVAAGRPRLRGRLEAVLSLGGYGDLPRALRFLCTGELPDGSHRTPHDYGLAVIALAAVPRLVPADQTAALERGIRTFLEASLDDSPAQTRASALVADARAQAAALPEPARGILDATLDRRVDTLGRLLAPLVDSLASDPALSPERSPITDAPVFLLHGRDDNVIPSTETPLAAADLIRRGNPHVQWLLTPLLSHADLGGHAALTDGWHLLSFWRRVLTALE